MMFLDTALYLGLVVGDILFVCVQAGTCTVSTSSVPALRSVPRGILLYRPNFHIIKSFAFPFAPDLLFGGLSE